MKNENLWSWQRAAEERKSLSRNWFPWTTRMQSWLSGVQVRSTWSRIGNFYWRITSRHFKAGNALLSQIVFTLMYVIFTIQRERGTIILRILYVKVNTIDKYPRREISFDIFFRSPTKVGYFTSQVHHHPVLPKITTIIYSWSIFITYFVTVIFYGKVL